MNFDDYLDLQSETAAGAALRKQEYARMVETYYSFATNFYQLMWGDSFHFAPRRSGETLKESLTRHEHWLAHRLGLDGDMRVADFGCGVGGPMRSIARFCEASITGITISPEQVVRGAVLNRRAGLESRCRIVWGDFMDPPFHDNEFDAAYDLGAIIHSPDHKRTYEQVYRILRPGGVFGGYEWCMTERFDPVDPIHRQVKRHIERGTAVPDIPTSRQTGEYLQAAGFELLETQDRMDLSDPRTPWYLPLTGHERNLRYLLFSKPGRLALDKLTAAGEWARILPAATTKITEVVMEGVDALVQAGMIGIFTPAYFFMARKPAA